MRINKGLNKGGLLQLSSLTKICGEIASKKITLDYIDRCFIKTIMKLHKGLENQLLSASFLSMKHYFESAWLEANLAELFSAISDEHRNLNQQYLVYLLNFVMLDIEKMKQITSNLSSAKTAVIMNTIDLLRQEGIEIGMEKGIEKGIEIGIEKDKELIVCNAFKNNISLFMIANITQLSESQVMDILKKFELV